MWPRVKKWEENYFSSMPPEKAFDGDGCLRYNIYISLDRYFYGTGSWLLVKFLCCFFDKTQGIPVLTLHCWHEEK